jgi:Zn-dependent M28 family amino/carboxypeptidase
MRHLITISMTIIALAIASLATASDGKSIHVDSIRAQLDNHPTLDSLIQTYADEISADSIKSYIQQLIAFKTRFMLADNRKDIAVWIGNKFTSFGYQNIQIDSFQNTIEFPLKSGKHHTTWQYNVYTSLAGSASASDVCVLGAHYDCMIMGPDTDPFTYAPGADNNASGVAVCLEIARIFKQGGFVPKWSIEFIAFGSEEFMTMFVDGASGAENHVRALKESGKTIRMMIDNNQISFSSDTADWKLDFQNYPGAEHLTDAAHVICDKYTDITPIDANDHIPYTDARYFHEAGVPCIFFEEFHFNPYTFSAKDIPDNCNMQYCTEVAKISCGMLIYLNN